ncbi:MAG: hypothetical protein JO366_19045, partial [Methylobacteriaceae bacterium]|nr:hypothetical protein [Methylobacteriaceae bacterium]
MLQTILEQEFGPALAGYKDFYVAYQGSGFFSSEDFSYWDLNDKQVSKWLSNGTDIARRGIGPTPLHRFPPRNFRPFGYR